MTKISARASLLLSFPDNDEEIDRALDNWVETSDPVLTQVRLDLAADAVRKLLA